MAAVELDIASTFTIDDLVELPHHRPCNLSGREHFETCKSRTTVVSNVSVEKRDRTPTFPFRWNEENNMTLQSDLNAITANVKQQAPTEVFAAMEAANVKLADSGLANKAAARGQSIPEFELPDANGNLVRSKDLLRKGPVVISFYRGVWCPYCSVELKAPQDRLADITQRGATLVAISPQTPDSSLTTKEKLELAFPVLSDVGNVLARKFGLVFALDPTLRPIYTAFGIDLQASNGDASWELPVPATYVVGSDGKIVDVFVDVDYRNRLEPDVILQWLDKAH